MMQEEIGDHHFRFRQGVLKHVPLQPLRLRWPMRWPLRKIHGLKFRFAAEACFQNTPPQRATASPELEHSPPGFGMAPDLTHDPAMIAHDKVDRLQFTPALDCGRMVV